LAFVTLLSLQNSSDDSGCSGRNELSVSDMSDGSKLHSLRSRRHGIDGIVTRRQFASLPKLDVTTAVLEVARCCSLAHLPCAASASLVE